jgi:hypothetical protein
MISMKVLSEVRVLVDKKSTKRTTKFKCYTKVIALILLQFISCANDRHASPISSGTGLQVSCQREREREKNRFIALRTLVEKIELTLNGSAERDDELASAQKQRARRRRRSRAANAAHAAAGDEDR